MRKPCLFLPAAMLLVAAFTPLSPGQNSTDQKKPLGGPGRRDINSGGPGTTMSIEDEIRLGRQLSRQFEMGVILDQDPATLSLVERIGQIIARNSDVHIPITLRVVENEQPNVLSLPGGYVYVTKGLIRMSGSEAELAFALAHGIAHVAARHAVERGGAQSTSSFLPLPVSIFTGGILAPSTPTLLSSVGFSKASVEEADFLGLQYLHKAGYDPQAAATLLEQIEARSSIAGASSNVLQTHPSLSERIRKMEESQRVLPSRDSHILTTQEFDSVHSR